MELREYQAKAKDNVLRDTRSGVSSSVLVLPTGAGKTTTAAAIVKEYLETEATSREVVVWLAHRTELVSQAVSAFKRHGLETCLWTATEKSTNAKVIVCSVQSSRKLEEALLENGKSCRFMVVDEAHHRPAPTYKRLEKQLRPNYVLGLTATPVRLDDLDLGFDKVSYQLTFLELVEMGYLAAPRYVCYNTALAYPIRSRDGEFLSEDLKQLNNDKRNSIIALDYVKHRHEYGKTVVFCIDVEHCHQLQSMFARQDPSINTAVIHGGTPSQVRADTIQALKKSLVDIVFNVMVLTEGFDEPSIRTVMLTRPTKSESLWQQMVGRGARGGKNSGMTKTTFNIVDYVDEGNNYAILCEDWSMRLLNADSNPFLDQRREEQMPVDRMNDWLADHGPKTKKVKEKREVLEIAGVMVLRTKGGDEKRYIVKKNHKDRLSKFINYMMSNPPQRPQLGSIADGLDLMLYDYSRRIDKSTMKWPGKFLLKKLAWAIYFRYITKRADAKGRPTFEYIKLPDFVAQEQYADTAST